MFGSRNPELAALTARERFKLNGNRPHDPSHIISRRRMRANRAAYLVAGILTGTGSILALGGVLADSGATAANKNLQAVGAVTAEHPLPESPIKVTINGITETTVIDGKCDAVKNVPIEKGDGAWAVPRRANPELELSDEGAAAIVAQMDPSALVDLEAQLGNFAPGMIAVNVPADCK